MKLAIGAAAALLLVSCGGRDEAGNEGAPASGGNATAAGNAQAGADGGDGGAAAAAGAVAEMRPGQWETTVEVLRVDMGNVPGMPPGMTPPGQGRTSVRSCLTPEQARRPNANFMTGADQAGCTYENFSMAGGRVRGTATCNQAGSTVRTTIDGSFAAESYRIETQSQVSTNGMNVETSTRISGRRIGDCPG